MKKLSISNLRLLSHSFATTSRVTLALQDASSSLAFGNASRPAGALLGNARPWVSKTLQTSTQESPFRREGHFTPWRMMGTQNVPVFREVGPTIHIYPPIQFGLKVGRQSEERNCTSSIQKYLFCSKVGSLDMCWSNISASPYQSMYVEKTPMWCMCSSSRVCRQ
jgi:hypothetical protein